jgi:hypothetical protein
MKTRAQSTIMTGCVALFLVASVTASSATTNIVGTDNTSWSFESYTNGQDIGAISTDSWYGEAGYLVALTNSYDEPTGGYPMSGASHGVVMELTEAVQGSGVSNLVQAAAGVSVWVDHIIKLVILVVYSFFLF